MYDDNQFKFVAVLNKRHSSAAHLNALGHITAGLMPRIGIEAAEILEYPSPGGGFTASISRHPVIVLAADNNSQLRRLCAAAAQDDIPHNVFTTTMIGSSAAAQIAATEGATADELDYIAVILFGATDAVGPLTRRFSLIK